jgi:hypothetical protein
VGRDVSVICAYKHLAFLSCDLLCRKLIGGKFFVKGYAAAVGGIAAVTEAGDFLSVRDSDGHGTHTSSTAAGNFVAGSSFISFLASIARFSLLLRVKYLSMFTNVLEAFKLLPLHFFHFFTEFSPLLQCLVACTLCINHHPYQFDLSLVLPI